MSEAEKDADLMARRVMRQPVKASWRTRASASVAAAYLRFVNATNPLRLEPPGFFEGPGAERSPLIFVLWHGQGFMLPFARPHDFPVDVLVSLHGDGELVARMLMKLGLGTVRGAGSRRAEKAMHKGGARAFIAMRQRLREGVTVALTADFDKKGARQVSPGIVALARATGRPIVPLAFATSRSLGVRSWDRTTLHLPFGRAACVFGDFIEVPDSADTGLVERKRQQIEDALNAATTRARDIVESRHG